MNDNMTLRAAVVGAGPAGYYASEALLKRSNPSFAVDLFERLPMPYGLVRYGVAPDHQKIKSVTRAFDKIAQHPGFRFFGNVTLGQDLSAPELLERYDAVVLCIGCGSDRKLGIVGEDLIGVYPATRFVAWYNGHPDLQDYPVKLDHEHAVVVGAGDVSLDITRMLLRDHQDLAHTDITDAALAVFRESRVRRITIVVRRGPAQAPFALKELRDIAELPNVIIKLDPQAIANAFADPAASDSLVKRKLEYLAELAAIAPAPRDERSRVVEFMFQHLPLEVSGNAGRVSALVLQKARLVTDAHGNARAEPTAERVVLEAGLLFPAVGYRGVPTPLVPFDEQAGVIPNQAGRVALPEGEVIPGLYTAGWIKRGPSGVIGTNKSCANDTVNLIAQDLAAGPRVLADLSEPIETLLEKRGVRAVSQNDWAMLDRIELERGESLGKVRQKLTNVSEALALLAGVTPPN